MIERVAIRGAVLTALRRNPVAAILGPRQCGKTTLARTIAAETSATWFDLEDPVALRRLDNPMLALEPLRGLVIIDEIQRKPELFPILRVLADREAAPARFLLLGSASPHLLRMTSETLAGRIEYIELGGFDTREVGQASMTDLWLRGGFPRSFLAASQEDSWAWREAFIRTFLERDLPQLGVGTPAPTLRRFWTMLAHYHGQVWSGAELGRALGVSAKTVRHYLDILTASFVVRQLQPWHENLAKRQVKSPKVYVRDSGILHSLLGIDSSQTLAGHPKVGASWEGFVVEEILRHATGDPYFWATHGGAEIDLVLMRRSERFGIEIKHAEAPALTRSMRTAMLDLRLDHLLVVYPGNATYALDDNITVVPLSEVATHLAG